MTYLNWEDFKKQIKELLDHGYLVFAGTHTHDWFNFTGRAIQLTGYFAHTLYIVQYEYIGEKLFILTIEADGKTVAWHNIDEYRKKVLSGREELTIAYIKSQLRRKLRVDRRLDRLIDTKYDHKGNIWHGITTVMTWFGDFWKAVSGQLSKINPLAEKGKFRCSGFTTHLLRIAGYNFLPGQETAAVTPTEFMQSTLLIKEFQTTTKKTTSSEPHTDEKKTSEG